MHIIALSSVSFFTTNILILSAFKVITMATTKVLVLVAVFLVALAFAKPQGGEQQAKRRRLNGLREQVKSLSLQLM